MGIWLGPRGKTVITKNDFSYSGNYLFKSDGDHWELALLDGDSDYLVFTKNPGLVDIFIVAGGASGKTGSGSAQYGPTYGGDGGAGGECINADGILMQSGVNYSATIGLTDQSTSLSGGGLNYTARTGYGEDGGRGGCASQGSSYDADPGDDGVYAYNKVSDTLLFTEQEFPGHRFGAGGGGGGCMISISGYPWSNVSGALGGESNGSGHIYGAGAYSSVTSSDNASAGFAKHGQGGGGAYRYWYYQSSQTRNGTVGTGGSGVIFIRDAR